MPKQLQLSIPKPCHEDWDKMSQVEKGRFCGSCQKQVMDFTNMSDSQLVAFFKKEATGSVCGRFMPEQLDKAMDIPKKRIPWVKYFFQFTLPLFLASLKSTAQTKKGEVTVKQVEARNDTVCKKPDKLVMMLGATAVRIRDQHEKVITGSVIGVDDKPVPYATVMIKGTVTGTKADSAGVFRITIPAMQDSAILSVSSIGYENKDVILTEDDRRIGLVIIPLTVKLMSEVVVIGYSTIKGMVITDQVSSIRKITVKKENPDFSLATTITAAIYPNPVPAGEAVNVKCEKMEEDYYSFQLVTAGGQQVFQKEIWIDKDAAVLNIQLPKVAPGMYFIVMTGRQSGKKITDKIVIQ